MFYCALVSTLASPLFCSFPEAVAGGYTMMQLLTNIILSYFVILSKIACTCHLFWPWSLQISIHPCTQQAITDAQTALSCSLSRKAAAGCILWGRAPSLHPYWHLNSLLCWYCLCCFCWAPNVLPSGAMTNISRSMIVWSSCLLDAVATKHRSCT